MVLLFVFCFSLLDRPRPVFSFSKKRKWGAESSGKAASPGGAGFLRQSRIPRRSRIPAAKPHPSPHARGWAF